MLSARKIQHARPGRHSDGNGLHLLVKPSGSESWVLRIQHNGRRRDFGLGTAVTGLLDVDVPLQKGRSLTLSQAREKARLARELVKDGMDPSHLVTPSETLQRDETIKALSSFANNNGAWPSWWQRSLVDFGRKPLRPAWLDFTYFTAY